MRFSQLVFLLLLAGFNLPGQKMEVDFSQFQFSESYSLGVDTVIDARPQKEILGYAADRTTKEFRPLFPHSNVAGSLQSVLKSNDTGQEDGLILRLNRLFVYHTEIQNIRHLSVEASITFIQKKNHQYLEQFTATKTVRKEAYYEDGHAATLLQAALDSCLLHYAKRKKAGLTHYTALSPHELSKSFDGSQSTVRQMPHHIKGLFYTFYDLRDYSIATKPFFQVEFIKNEKDKPREARLKFEDKAMRKKDIYAFSNGYDIFVKTGKHYTEVTDSAGEFWLNQYPEFATMTGYDAGAISATVLFGLSGFALFDIIAKRPELLNRYILDFERGAVVPAYYPHPDEVTSEILFYGSSDLNETDTINLIIDGSQRIRLGYDQYYIHTSDARCLPVHACVQWGGITYCEEITPKIIDATILQCELIDGQVGMDLLKGGRENSVEAAMRNGWAIRVYP